MTELRPSSIIIDVYKVIQNYPGAGHWAIELRFLPKPIYSEWVLLSDIEDKASEIDKILTKYNIMKRKDAYISMAIHDFEKVAAKLKRLQEEEQKKADETGKKTRKVTLERIQGDAETTSGFTLALVVDIDNENIHKTKVIESEEEAFKAAKDEWERIKPKVQEVFGTLPRWVLFTGGGLQLWFVAPEPEPISVINRASEIVPSLLNKVILSKSFNADNIFDPARIVRAPLTLNHKYKAKVIDQNGTEQIVPTQIQGRVIEFNDVRTSLSEMLDKAEAYAKEQGITLEKSSKRRFLELASKRYEVMSSNFADLAERLFQELKPWWQKANEKSWSRHHLTMAIATYILRNTNLTDKDLIGDEKNKNPGIWEIVFSKLVEAGLEDPDDWKNRATTIQDAYDKIQKGAKVATKAYLTKYIEGLSEEEAVQLLLSVKKALLPYIKAVDVKRLSKYDAKPYPAEEAPTKWEDVDENRKRATGVWYVDVLALETADNLYIEDLPKPGVFFKERKNGKPKFNDALYQSFLEWLGVKEGEPIGRGELIDLIVEKFNLTVEDLKAIYYRKILNLLRPEGMRTPKCIEEFLLELATEGNLSEDKVKHLAHWIKFYAKPLRHSTTSILLRGEGKAIDMRMAIWAKVVEFFAEDDEVIEELITAFKKAYKEAEPPFPCIGAKTCPFYPDHKACPFIVPKRKEILPVSLVDVQLHGSDGIVILVGGSGETKTFIRKGKVEWRKENKKTVKYPIAEWFLDRFAKEYLNLPEPPSWWSPEEVTEILKSRARVVKSQFDEFEDYLGQFVEWLQKENSRRGVLPYEKADENHLFIKGKWIGIPPGFAREFYSGELLIGGAKFRMMLEQKLGRHYRKAEAKILLNTGIKDSRDCYFVSVEWFRKRIGEPNIQDVTAEGDISVDGLSYEDEEGDG